jgi:hypothetical protein
MPWGGRYGPHPKVPAFPQQRRTPDSARASEFRKPSTRIGTGFLRIQPSLLRKPPLSRGRGASPNSARASILRDPMVTHTASGPPAPQPPAPDTWHTAHAKPLVRPRLRQCPPPPHTHPKTTKGSRLSDCLPIGYLFRRIRERSRGAGARSSGYRPCSCA